MPLSRVVSEIQQPIGAKSPIFCTLFHLALLIEETQTKFLEQLYESRNYNFCAAHAQQRFRDHS